MDEPKATEIKARRKKTKSDVSSSGVSACCGDQHLKDQANFKAQLQECQSKVDSLESEKRTLLERIEILTEQNKRQAKFQAQVACVLSRPASIVCILAILVGVFLLCNNMASESHLLRERNAALTEQNASLTERNAALTEQNASLTEQNAAWSERNAALTEQNSRQSSRIKKLETDSDRFDIQFREQKVKLDAMNSENLLLRQQIAFENKQNGALTEQNNRQSSQIKKLETDSDRFETQLREQKVKLDTMNSENLLLRQQIEFSNEQKEFLQSQLTSKSVELREKDEKATAVRLQESQFNLEGMNYLVRCLRDENSASERFTGINLFWGAVQVGYTTKSGLDNCLTMHQAHYRQRIAQA